MKERNRPNAKTFDLRNDDIWQLSEVERGLVLEAARVSLEDRAQGACRAYLLTVETSEDDPAQVQESLQELGALVRSLGDDCVGVAVQRRPRYAANTLIGSGKAHEIRAACSELRVDYVVSDRDLSSSQVRNLEQIIGKPVLDRTGVILQIFWKNAKTREAKTQVEIARLEYVLPRLSNSWIAWERQRGSSGGTTNRLRGSGEAEIELDRRRVRDKISTLKRDLEKIQKERVTQRRLREEEHRIVLVGYTNAGKTTVMNGLTESNLSIKNALFETLDSSVRVLKGLPIPRVLITDTVGFIRNLPHSLVASFRSTLEEACHADLLLHVVDVSHSRFKEHIEVTNQVLREIGAADVPCMFVFNKVDAMAGNPRMAKVVTRNFANSVCISAQASEDITRLREKIVDYFVRDMEEFCVDIPYSDAHRIGEIYLQTRVLSMIPGDDVASFKVRAFSTVLDKLFPDRKATQVATDNPKIPVEEPSCEVNIDEELDPWNSGEYNLPSTRRGQE